MPYATMADLRDAYKAPAPAPAASDRFFTGLGQIEGGHILEDEDFSFDMVSPSKLSVFHPDNNLNEMVTIGTGMEVNGQVVKITMPLHNMMIPFEKMTIIPESAGGWGYQGRAILDYDALLRNRFNDFGIRGKIKITIKGFEAHTIRWGMVSLKERIRLGSSSGWFMVGALLSGSQKWKDGNVDQFKDVFSHYWDYDRGFRPGPNIDIAIDPTNGTPSAWSRFVQRPSNLYLPDVVTTDIDNYYNVADLPDPIGYLTDMGYPNPKEELISRAEFKTSFPEGRFYSFWYKRLSDQKTFPPSKYFDHINPARARTIAKMMGRRELGHIIACDRGDLKNMYNAVPSGKRQAFLGFLDRVLLEIETQELRAFNYNYLRYIQKGMMPATAIAASIAVYNAYLQEQAEKAEREASSWDITRVFETVVGTTMSFIPVVGPVFSAALTMNNASSNMSEIRKAQREQEAYAETLAEEMKKAEDVIAVYNVKEQDQLVEKQAAQKKQLVTVGVIASALAAGAAMLMGD